MNTPNICKVSDVYNSDTLIREKNIPARPLGYHGLFILKRIKTAWYVFVGKYDALDWEQ